MIKFNSLNEALHYRDLCPICKAVLKFNKHDLVGKYDENRLAFSIDYTGKNIMYINPNTEKVEIVFGQKNMFSSESCGNENFLRLERACDKCFCYSYIIRIHISSHFKSKPIITSILNTERVSVFHSDDDLYKIKNNFIDKSTEFSIYYFNSLKYKAITLPLIDINIFNPMETINRIKKIITYL